MLFGHKYSDFFGFSALILQFFRFLFSVGICISSFHTANSLKKN